MFECVGGWMGGGNKISSPLSQQGETGVQTADLSAVTGQGGKNGPGPQDTLSLPIGHFP